MHVKSFDSKTPRIEDSTFIHDTAVVIGDVELAADVSIWPLAVVRGDIHSIKIGRRSNIQDGSVIHVTHASDFNPGGYPVVIGEDVTVGHKVTLHGCTIGNRCLIGMGAIVMDGAIVNDQVIIGAGSIVPPGKVLESGYLYIGSPVKKARPINEKEAQFLTYSPQNYARLKNKYLNEAT
ncbi:gamma carbonic anhydrase family protein [uncultured Cycloclasticus sp.]|uniref:gamma carbonic anhydrase family protein n=1 Tax=uncultured Cycloclasticus sp. TaxID=172194 RepID=UPI002585E2DE|nr:gamma carbonic anhydrase family protein [uncultured Cycloclasticus sp.]